MKMITAKTAELQDAPLDWAVAMAEGWQPDRPQDGQVKKGNQYRVCGFNGDRELHNRYAFNPSTDWAQGGPLIEEYVDLIEVHGECCARVWLDEGSVAYQYGDTILIASCRALVAAKLGDEVQVPAELMEGHDDD